MLCLDIQILAASLYLANFLRARFRKGLCFRGLLFRTDSLISLCVGRGNSKRLLMNLHLKNHQMGQPSYSISWTSLPKFSKNSLISGLFPSPSFFDFEQIMYLCSRQNPAEVSLIEHWKQIQNEIQRYREDPAFHESPGREEKYLPTHRLKNRF